MENGIRIACADSLVCADISGSPVQEVITSGQVSSAVRLSRRKNLVISFDKTPGGVRRATTAVVSLIAGAKSSKEAVTKKRKKKKAKKGKK